MLDFKKIDIYLTDLEGARLGVVAVLRENYDVEQEEGIDCAGDEELQVLESIGSDEVLFEDCSITEIVDVVAILKKWNAILTPD